MRILLKYIHHIFFGGVPDRSTLRIEFKDAKHPILKERLPFFARFWSSSKFGYFRLNMSFIPERSKLVCAIQNAVLKEHLKILVVSFEKEFVGLDIEKTGAFIKYLHDKESYKRLTSDMVEDDNKAENFWKVAAEISGYNLNDMLMLSEQESLGESSSRQLVYGRRKSKGNI